LRSSGPEPYTKMSFLYLVAHGGEPAYDLAHDPPGNL
jgi:hypothetical protein